MTPESPTRRPTDADHRERGPTGPVELLNLPWIDVHNHAHTLSWADRERYALAGCRAMVMVASGIHWTPYRPVRAEDVRYLWDLTLNRRGAIERNHFYETALAVGAPTRIRIENPDTLFDAMDGYCELEAVVAVGEIGVTPAQHGSAWSLDGQRAAVRTQMEIASRHDLPVILHTPNRSVDVDRDYRTSPNIPGYEIDRSLLQEPVIDADNAALEAVRLDVAAADAAGLDQERIVASHADANNARYLLEQTDCHLSFTLGTSWLTGVTPATVAAVIDEYGPDRVMVDTDCANVIRSDPLSIKRAIMELYRLGVDASAIRQVVLDNPRNVFDIGT